jgi:hypothetical protein
MDDTKYDVYWALALSIAIALIGWRMVRLRREKFAVGTLVLISIAYLGLVFGALTHNGKVVIAALFFGCPAGLVLGIAGIAYRKQTPKRILIISQIGCWLLVSIPTSIIVAFLAVSIFAPNFFRQ